MQFWKSMEFMLIAVITLMAAIVQVVSPGFISVQNLSAIGRDASVTAILAAGLTIVVLTGGIDLSIASTLAFSASVMGILMQSTGGIILPIVAGLASAVGIGLVNGWLIAGLRISAIVATLATLSLWRFQAMKMVTLITPLPAGFSEVASGVRPTVVGAVVVLLVWFVLTKTVWGRQVYAVGGSEQAARLSGVSNLRIKALAYVMCSFLAGVAGVMQSATLNSVQGNMLTGYELDAVAAVVLGGVSLNGGRGSVIAVALGAVLMASLSSALLFAGLDAYFYKLIIGCGILTVGVLDSLWTRQKKMLRQPA